ncbi:MAG: hypothetical protein AVO35_06130, partial [Candidatus Aegiribacteria sp. MLS_C]
MLLGRSTGIDDEDRGTMTRRSQNGSSILILSMTLLVLVPDILTAGQGWSPTAAAQLTIPQKLSVSVGMAGIPWGRIWSDDGGLLVRLEPGLSGGKLHVGFRSAFSILFFPAVASDICGSVLY